MRRRAESFPSFVMDVSLPGSSSSLRSRKLYLKVFEAKFTAKSPATGSPPLMCRRLWMIKKHPEVSGALLEEVRTELGQLMTSASVSISTDRSAVLRQAGARDLGVSGACLVLTGSCKGLSVVWPVDLFDRDVCSHSGNTLDVSMISQRTSLQIPGSRG